MKKIFIPILVLILLALSLYDAQATIGEGELIKGESFSAVYYKAVDGKRYVFPNQRIYNSWYDDFSGVTTITDAELADVPMAGNVFYKPNSRLVKITTDPKTYWVDEFGVLRHIASEAAAQALFGTDWTNKVDDLSDAFFVGYTIGSAIDVGFSLSVEDDWVIDDNHQLTEKGINHALQQEEEPADTAGEEEEEEPADSVGDEEIVDEGQQPSNINLTVTVSGLKATLEWVVTGGNTNYGFMAVKSESENPTYPDDDYQEVTNTTAESYVWSALSNGDALHFRVCRLNSDGSCGTYSDDEAVVIGASNLTPTITLSGEVVDGVAELSWDTQWLSPDNGFYIIRNTSANPEYPTHPHIWRSKEIESYNWEGLNGTHHFRVCKYEGDSSDIACKYYSNDLELTIE